MKADILPLHLVLSNPELIGKTSPFYVQVLKVHSPTSMTLVSFEQFDIKQIESTYGVSANLPPDTYRVEGGFYLLDDLNRGEALFYRDVFSVIVVEKLERTIVEKPKRPWWRKFVLVKKAPVEPR